MRPAEEPDPTMHIRTRRTLLALAAAPALALSVSACGAGSVDGDEVEDQAESQLEQQFGIRPDIDCEDDLPAEEGATITCGLTVDGEDGTYDVTVTTRSVDGDTANFDIEVADTPR